MTRQNQVQLMFILHNRIKLVDESKSEQEKRYTYVAAYQEAVDWSTA